MRQNRKDMPKRNAIKRDIFYFVIPAIFIFTTGLFICAWSLVSKYGSLYILSVQSIVGLTFIVLGYTIAVVALITLRGSYSATLVIRKDHKLITHGIFRLIRHPIYLGIIVVTIGFPVYALSLYGLIIMLVLIPIFLVRIGIEEKMLTDEFGDKYRAYQKETSKLIPYIY